MTRLFLVATLILPLAGVAPGQTPEISNPNLDKAYEALRAKNYEQAIAGFEEAMAFNWAW